MYATDYTAAALLDIGERETMGPNRSPFLIRLWAGLRASWLLGQPWCGGILAKWVNSANLPYPKHFYRAKDWATWGVDAMGPMLGSIAVIERKGGGHVGIVMAVSDDGYVQLLGGNQGDTVKTSWFSIDRVIAYRLWPTDINVAQAAPLRTAGAMSTSEA
jgi:uncharacterized protein (TIGR02594 family)